MSEYGLTATETRILKALKTPQRIQHFLDLEIGYNKEPDGEDMVVVAHGAKVEK